MARARSKSRTPSSSERKQQPIEPSTDSKSKELKKVEASPSSKRRRTRSSPGAEILLEKSTSTPMAAAPVASRSSPRRPRSTSVALEAVGTTAITAAGITTAITSGGDGSAPKKSTSAKKKAPKNTMTLDSPPPTRTKSPRQSKTTSSKASRKGKGLLQLQQEEELDVDDASNAGKGTATLTSVSTNNTVTNSANNTGSNKTKKHHPTPPPGHTVNVRVHRVRHLDYIPSPVLAMTATPNRTTMQTTTTPMDGRNNNATASSSSYLALSRQDGSVELFEATNIPEYPSASNKRYSPHLFPLATIQGSPRAVAHSLVWVNNSSSHSPPTLVAASPDGTLWTIHFFTTAASGTGSSTIASSRPLQSRITSGGGGVFDLTTCQFAQHSTTTSSSSSSTTTTTVCHYLPLVAGACQDGSVRIWRVGTNENTTTATGNSNNNGNGLQEPPAVTLPTAGAPILSLAWRCVSQKNNMSGAGSGTTTTTFFTEVYAGVADGTIRKYQLDFEIVKQTIPGQEDLFDTTLKVLKLTPILRMTVESRGRRTPTKVWTMRVLDDGSLVTGNSLGQVQIWDTFTGTLVQSVQQTELKADVLQLVVNPAQTKVFASGVDSRVICLERSSPSTSSSNTTAADRTWKFTTAQRPHTHDVKCMAIVHDDYNRYTHASSASITKEGDHLQHSLEALVTAGVDTKLCTYVVSDFAKRRPQVYYPWPSQSPVSTTTNIQQDNGHQRRCILAMRRDNHIELYRLNDLSKETAGRLEGDKKNEVKTATSSSSELIGEIALETQSNLSLSLLSPNGEWLATANATRLFLFSLKESSSDSSSSSNPTMMDHHPQGDDEESGDLEPEQIPLPKPLDRITVVALYFSGSTLFVADSCHHVYIVDLQQKGAVSIVSTLRLSIPSQASTAVLPISSLRTTAGGKYLVAMSKSSHDGIHIFQRRSSSSSTEISTSTTEYVHFWTIPSLANARPAAIAFCMGDDDSHLAVATASSQIFIFHLAEKKLSSWSEANGFPMTPKWPMEISHRRDFPVRLFANPQNPSQLIMASFGAFVVLNLNGKLPKHCRMVPEMHVRRRRKRGRDEESLLAAAANNANPIIFAPAPPQDRNNHGRLDPNARNCTVCLHYNSMLYFDFLANNEMVVVEQPWLRVVSTFPEALQRQVYGCN